MGQRWGDLDDLDDLDNLGLSSYHTSGSDLDDLDAPDLDDLDHIGLLDLNDLDDLDASDLNDLDDLDTARPRSTPSPIGVGWIKARTGPTISLKLRMRNAHSGILLRIENAGDERLLSTMKEVPFVVCLSQLLCFL